MRLSLRFCHVLSRHNTWRMSDDVTRGVDLRIRVASAEEVYVSVPLRRLQYARLIEGRLYVKNDGDRFTIESAVLHPSLPRLIVDLIEPTEEVAAAMRLL